jgi:hypothetical protein
MADNYTARKQPGWRVVSIAPDVCKTPMGSSIPPVPYPVRPEQPNVSARTVPATNAAPG